MSLRGTESTSGRYVSIECTVIQFRVGKNDPASHTIEADVVYGQSLQYYLSCFPFPADIEGSIDADV